MAENNIQSGDYISPASIKTALADFFRFFFRSFDFVLSSIRRHKLLFFSCVLIGLLFGLSYSIYKSNYYKAEMIVQQSSLSRKAYYEIIANLNNMIKTGSYEDLGSELKLDKQEIDKLVSVECLSLGGESLKKDTSTRIGQAFKIQVKTKDNVDLPSLQKSLVNYLNNNDYVREKREGLKKIYMQKLEFIALEQKKLDSLKETYNRTLSSTKLPSTFYNNALNPTELYTHSLALYNQKESILNWLNTEGNGILLIDGFKKQHRLQSVPKTFYILAGLVAGMAMGVFLTLFVSLKEQLK